MRDAARPIGELPSAGTKKLINLPRAQSNFLTHPVSKIFAENH